MEMRVLKALRKLLRRREEEELSSETVREFIVLVERFRASSEMERGGDGEEDDEL